MNVGSHYHPFWGRVTTIPFGVFTSGHLLGLAALGLNGSTKGVVWYRSWLWLPPQLGALVGVAFLEG